MSGAWLFGKLPSHGDFVCRGLGLEERTELDAWLSEEMAGARLALAADFEAAFDRAPPWRFAWRGEAGWTGGAIAASRDAAGRRFPIVIARSGLSETAVEGAALACEEAIYEAFGEGAFEAAVRRIESRRFYEGGGAPERDGWWCPGCDPLAEVRREGRRPAGLLVAMLTLTEAPA